MATGLLGAVKNWWSSPKGHIGSWGLPDFGITEVFADTRNVPRDPYTGGSQSFGQYTQPEPYVPPDRTKTPGTQTTGGGGAGTVPPSYTPPGPSGDNSGQQLQDQRTRELQAIQAEFDQEVGRLAGLERTTQSRYQEAKGQAEQRYPEHRAMIEQEQALREKQLGDVEIQRKQESQSALSRARNLLAELQRRQQAYLSATGQFSTSTPEAMAEQFGRQAFGAQSTVQTSRDQALRQVETEKMAAQQFYSNKLIEAKRDYEGQLGGLQQQLQSQLDQIDAAKGQAASAKRAASIEAWRGYTQTKMNLDMQLRAYQDSLNLWYTQLNAQAQAAAGYQVPEIPGVETPQVNLGAGTQAPQAQAQGVGFMAQRPEEDEALAGLNLPGLVGRASV